MDSSGSSQSDTITTVPCAGNGTSGGWLGKARLVSRVSSNIVSATRRTATRPEIGRRPVPSTAIRSPASVSRLANASAINSARTALVSMFLSEAYCMEGEASRHSHTDAAASHSVSRTNRWRLRALCRQSIWLALSPARYGRYCQKASPWPTRRLPCTPWITVAATRSAATISAGRVPANSRERCRVDGWAIGSGADPEARLRDAGAHLGDHGLHRDALGAGREVHGHAMAQDRTGERHDIVDRGREAALDDGAGAGGQHERLTGARPRSPC